MVLSVVSLLLLHNVLAAERQEFACTSTEHSLLPVDDFVIFCSTAADVGACMQFYLPEGVTPKCTECAADTFIGLEEYPADCKMWCEAAETENCTNCIDIIEWGLAKACGG